MKKWNDLELINAALDNGLAVYRFFMGETTQPYKKYHSPFRPEHDPSFQIYLSDKTGKYHYQDFGISTRNREGNCWEFMKTLLNLDFRDAVEYAKTHILHMSGEGYSGLIDPATIALKPITTKRSPTLIEPLRREWSDIDLIWWYNKGRISKATLELFYLYAAASYTMEKDNKEGERIRFTIQERASDPIYAIQFPTTGNHKIYRPLSDNPKFKWTSNTEAKRDLFGIHLLPGFAEKGFLIAGNSDTLSFYENIAKPLNYACVALNSENAKMTPEIWQFLRTVCPNWYSVYDNDQDKTVTDFKGMTRVINTGRQQTEELWTTWGIKPANQPLFQEDAKDICKLISKVSLTKGQRGLQEISQYYENFK
jgi:hypothetical protein